MAAAATVVPLVTESARERETFKYDALAISTAGLRNGPPPPKPIPSAFLSSTPDPALTAFARLGLYELRGTRVLISLFDRRFQHIVAEAVREQNPAETEWSNGLTFERTTSVCEHVVTAPAESQAVPGTDVGLTADDIPVSIINRLDADVRFCHVRDPQKQFYAGVPLRSPNGINIGVYCVFDNEPRPQGLNPNEVRFIRDMSRIVMDYLEDKRAHEYYRREQRMIHGLGNFVEGRSSLKDNTLSIPVPETPTAPKMQAPFDLDGGASNPAPEAIVPTLYRDQPHEQPSKDVEDSAVGGNASVAAVPSVQQEVKPIPLVPAEKPPATGDTLRDGVERIFSRTANVIRECIEVDGVIFLDASIQSYGGMVGNRASETADSSEDRHTSLESNSSDDARNRSGVSAPAASDNGRCNVLGHSLSDRPSTGSGDALPKALTECREPFLRRLLQRYPQGRIFNFEADGTVSDHSSGSGGDEAAKTANGDVKQPGAKKSMTAAMRISTMLPGARSVVLVPLWDQAMGRWFAGGFVWTKTPTRIFTTDNELNYLRVFGLAAMAELARLKVRAADKAKTDILGSISHELRSPLHGLIGTTELLRHTDLDGYQQSILWTIESSARTLLDTITHLLDYIKLDNARTTKPKGQRIVPHKHTRPTPAAKLASMELAVPIQLDLLVEEVVESALAGSSYLTMSDTHSLTVGTFARSPHPLEQDPFDRAPKGAREPLQIYLDIDHRARWAFRTHPGAFRRIVMNLFGNSLKFTTSGFVRLSLDQEGLSKRQPGNTNVMMRVSDSGKGIGEDYLRNHLFVPFSQEDQFATGTGLGLSLVQRMTESLNGSIDVQSKVGQGTTITVVLPLSQAVDEVTDDDIRFQQSIQDLAGQRVQLVGFEREPRTREYFHADDAREKSQYQLVEAVFRDVLHMDVVPAETNIEEDTPHFVISAALEPSRITEMDEKLSKCPHIFICQDLAAARKLMTEKQRLSRVPFEILSQPLGLRKVARALLACRQRWQSASITRAEELPPQIARAQSEGAVSSKLPSLTLPVRRQATPDVATVLESQQKDGPADSLKPPLPVRQPLPPPSAAVADSNPQASILVVDDNAINLKVLCAYMTKLKHPYTSAVNGLEALQIFSSTPNRFRCVLTDISMPVMDGLQSTRRMREVERAGGHAPAVIIAITGLSVQSVREEATASGVDKFFTRPLALQELEKALVDLGVRPASS